MYLKDREIAYSSDKLLPCALAYSIGTVFFVNPETKTNYKLLNYGFCPGDNHFYYTENVHLPRDFVNYFESCEVSLENEALMREFGLMDLNTALEIANQYGLEIKHAIECDEKVKEFTRKLTK